MECGNCKFKSRKTKICCTTNMPDGLINIEEIHQKALLFLFFESIHSYKANLPVALFLAYNVPFLSQ